MNVVRHQTRVCVHFKIQKRIIGTTTFDYYLDHMTVTDFNALNNTSYKKSKTRQNRSLHYHVGQKRNNL